MLWKRDKFSSPSDMISEFFDHTGFFYVDWRMMVMWAVSIGLLYLAVFKKFEPLLLVPIAFGALLANLPTKGIINEPAGEIRSPVAGEIVLQMVDRGDIIRLPMVARELGNRVGDLHERGLLTAALTGQPHNDLGENRLLYIVRPVPTDEYPAGTVVPGTDLLTTDTIVWARADGRITRVQARVGAEVLAGEALLDVHHDHSGGLFYYIQQGVLLELFPPLIFLGVGALTDFGPLIANPRMLLLGAAAQFGVFATLIGATFLNFSNKEAAAIGIIGGADGPTSIFLANSLAPELLAPIAVAAYSYMALVPVLQPPIMRALTTKKERQIRMQRLRPVSRLEKLVFALVVTVSCILLVPASAPLIGMLMLGNFLRECKVTERLNKTAQNELINIITILLGTSVGITMTGDRFLRPETLSILILGVVAFVIATGSGVLMAKLMNVFSKNKINPLIGSAGVSAVPMAARVSHTEGQRADPQNFLLMHAMGPNVAGVIGTALVAGYFLTVFGGGH
jgi:sodium ion-translocating decarboxylase beta subunit